MKTFLIAITAILLSFNLNAQIAIGGGIGYNQEVSSPGITVKAEFNITDKIAITPNVSYFFGGSTRFIGYNRNVLGIDVNATYAIDIIEKLKVYPVVGANFSSYKTRTTFFFIEDRVENETAFGANIGAGAQWQFTDKLCVYLEPKYVASNYSQIIVNAGVLLKL